MRIPGNEKRYGSFNVNRLPDNAQPNILVVEDDENILNLLTAYLESAGHQVSTAGDGNIGLELALSGQYDICVLDVMLPGCSGVEIASALKDAECDSAILFLTALGNEADILRGFGAGADDYMVKPFSPRELLVRVNAILRRVQAGSKSDSSTLELGPITLDTTQPVCMVDGVQIGLTPHEYRILRQLLKSPGRVLERRYLIAVLYGKEDAVSPKAIDVHVHNLRAKLGEEAGELIQTIRGFGYACSSRANHGKESVATRGHA